MPRERVFGPHDTETYRQYLGRLKDAGLEVYTPDSLAAAMMTTVMLMQHGNQRKIIQREPFNAARKSLEQSPAFKRMMRSPKVMQLLEKGDTTGLFTLLSATEAQRQQELDRKYKRPAEKEVLAKDAELLDAAMEGLKQSAGSAPQTGSPEIEQRGKHYQEMMKQLENAKTLAEHGIQLSGEQTKALITSVKAYNDGGKRYVLPGGQKQAEGFVQSMALLKNYMPAADFNRYCRQMNTARGIQSPDHPDFAAPEAFQPQRLSGSKTAKQLTVENRDKIRDSFTLDVAAEALAIRQLSGGDPNRLISPEALNKQKSKLKQPGTAFMKVMMDDRAREDLRHLADMGEAEEVVGDLNKGIDREKRRRDQEARQRAQDVQDQARKHVVRTAQGEINRSIRRLAGGEPLNRFFTEQYLANILASEMLAVNAKGDEKITNAAFRERAEELRQDPAFRALADRFVNEPQYREQMVDELLRDRSAKGLAEEFQKLKQPARIRREQQQEREQQPQEKQEQREQEQQEQPEQVRPGLQPEA